MKVTSNKTTSSETSATIDLETRNLSTQTKSEVGEFLVEQILSAVASRKSPVTGESFDPLSKDYKSDKQDQGLQGVPNLELTGSMLDSLDFRIEGDEIVIGVFGEDAPKADGHNNLSGESKLPERRFIPAEGQGFVSSIEREVARIINDAVAQDVAPPVGRLSRVQSQTELYEVLSGVFNITSRARLREAVIGSDRWTQELSMLGLLRFL